MAPPYLRHPDVRGDLVTFVAADDVWLAPVAGGRAWRLTDDRTPVRNSRFSPDGSAVAWTSTRDGHNEVYVVDVDGGVPHRLTWWGSATTSVLGWTADGRVLVASAAREANSSRQVVHAVGRDLVAERLPVGPASGIAVRADGATVVATVGSRPPAHWKRYRGGTAPRLWLDRTGAGQAWEQLLPDEAASLVDPSWVGDRLVFVSDRAARLPGPADEVADLWSLDVDDPAAGPRRVTTHTAAEGYVRDARTDGTRVVYTAHGTLYLLADLDGRPEALAVTLPGSVGARSSRQLEPTEDLAELRPDTGGDASLVEWRGKAFLLSHRQGPGRALAADSAVRARLVRPLGTGGSAVLVSDADGEDALHVHPLTGGPGRRLDTGPLGRVLHLESDPAGARVAAVSSDGAVRVVDVETGTARQVGSSRNGEATGPAFSPDGRWLVWSQPVRPFGQSRLVLADLDAPDADPVALTSGRFDDTSAAFTLDGRHLAFLSARTFDPAYDSHVFDLSFPAAVRPYLVPLTATEPAPFGPSADGWRISKPDPAPADADAPATPPPVSVDVEGFEQRLVAFPVPSGSYRDLHAAKDGVLWVREPGEESTLGARRAGVEGEAPGAVAEFFSFLTRELVELTDRADTVAVSGDGERLVLRSGDDVTVRPTGRVVKAEDPDLVRVDLGRLRFELDPGAEWRQMFTETATLMRDHYFRADLDGVDWTAVLDRYRPLVDRIAGHDDLVDLLWEVVGELNTSHAYVRTDAPAGDQERRLGLLGADLSPADGGWRIDRVLDGESSDPQARSPLRAAGVGARAGDLVVAVDGRPVDPQVGPAAGLVGAADRLVELTLRSGGEDRRVVVVPLASEEQLRYHDWVRGRAAYVQEHSGGRLGYVHVPDMMSLGWAQLHRDLHLATEAEGLVVDVRYNRGGHTSQLVLERLARRPVGWSRARHVDGAEPYPLMSPRGPVVLVANEYSGSDGDIVNAAAQALGLGPVVGTRTWGGVVGIDNRFELVDGTQVTQPRYAFWLEGKGWGVENHGVDPDIEVVHTPADHDGPGDPQLDRAIAEALQRLSRTPAARPPALPLPRVHP
ncbi:tricorn protease [Modestobacter sp. I12A-02628]|uniref:Tricorn protease homolog n=1 Tax=Goekera deserti TaxID=2497753 RepID=A0A7K3WA60_9ACTN|nr:S41 family peptidase [Goekera deserti]MPR00222.1 tricorn protease [Goekera deserti]NDI49396.1 tricorn protease [Goekera deserti]NEL52730.1 tricorn protease [Goekera deserti]